jgi:hypothetical protein
MRFKVKSPWLARRLRRDMDTNGTVDVSVLGRNAARWVKAGALVEASAPDDAAPVLTDPEAPSVDAEQIETQPEPEKQEPLIEQIRRADKPLPLAKNPQPNRKGKP